MSDGVRVYSGIKRALWQLYPNEAHGRCAQRLNTLAALMAGIVLGKSCQLPKVASALPGTIKDDSRVKQYTRWLKNDAVTDTVYYLPFGQALLHNLAALRTLVLALDGSMVGRGCLALMLSVIYQKRALPVAWLVVPGPHRQLSPDIHVALLERVAALLPPDADIVIVGDGEFDRVPLQQAAEARGYHYVCRTTGSTLVREAGRAPVPTGPTEPDEQDEQDAQDAQDAPEAPEAPDLGAVRQAHRVNRLRLARQAARGTAAPAAGDDDEGDYYGDDEWVALQTMAVPRGACRMWAGVEFTLAAYGPVQVIAWWGAAYAEPLYLVTNCALVEEACHWYRCRFSIETFFSDQKSRGFQLQQSHLSDPARLARLLIAACLAYLWLIYLGGLAHRTGLQHVIHRTERCDLSLFQLGLRLLTWLLKNDHALLIAFQPGPTRQRVLEPAPKGVR
jgi:hypothetical protein